MSKARLVITAVSVEKRPVAEVARAYGAARSWIYTLLARYQAARALAHESSVDLDVAGRLKGRQLLGESAESDRPSSSRMYLKSAHCAAASSETISSRVGA
jgi:hypothetical protein